MDRVLKILILVTGLAMAGYHLLYVYVMVLEQALHLNIHLGLALVLTFSWGPGRARRDPSVSRSCSAPP